MAQVTEQPQGVLLLLSPQELELIGDALAVAAEASFSSAFYNRCHDLTSKITEQQEKGGRVYEG